jgi:carboxyl-terminal processing protease
MNFIRFISPRLLGRLIVLIYISGVIPLALGQPPRETKPAPAKGLTPLGEDQRQRNLESFTKVWTTIRDKHWDPKLGGLNWQAVHDELRPQLDKAETMDQCRQILKDMIGRLGQSHFAIVPKDVYEEIDRKPSQPAADEGVPGFDVRVVDGQALVVHVDEGSPAARLGVRPGWQVLKIASQDLAPTLAQVQKTYKDRTTLQHFLVRAVTAQLQARSNEKGAVTFRNGEDKEVTLEIPAAKPKGVRAQFGHVPLGYIHYESRRLEPNIRYFALNAFFDPANVMKAFEKAVKESLKADGFILDLRGNPGGIGGMAMGMGNWFISQPDQKLGTMITRDTTLKFVLNPRLETFGGPLAVLVDGCSGSTAEILAGGLQDLKRARIFGSRTAGAALPSYFERLPNGDGFQYAVGDYVSTGGQRLEGRGVIPDVEVLPSRKALLEGHDPVLEAAVEWLRTYPKSPRGETK